MPLPALAHARRGGTEGAVELARAVDGPDDRVERDQLQAEPPLAGPAERAHHLLEGEDVVHVVGPAQPRGQARKRAPPARAAEVELRVGAREAGVPGHDSRLLRGAAGRNAAGWWHSRRRRRRSTVTRARTLRPARSARRASRGTGTVRMVKPRAGGSVAAALQRPLHQPWRVAPARQSWSGQRTLTTMPARGKRVLGPRRCARPVAAARCRRARVRRTCRRSAGEPRPRCGW